MGLKPNKFNWVVFSKGKLIILLLPMNVEFESTTFLEKIPYDICGLVDPPLGQFKYFMVFVNILTRWSHVCVLSYHN